MTTMTPTPIVRGCGVRAAGGCYWELHAGPTGMPLETFLIDPPILIGELVLPARGVVLIERDGVTHVVDHVGKESYPNLADFVEESKRFGISRRLPRTLPFGRLTEASRMLLVHDRAWNDDMSMYGSWRCPKNIELHDPAHCPRMCLGVAWEDVEGGEVTAGRSVRRTMPSFGYQARQRPDGVVPRYRPAFFLSIPCTQLGVVQGNGHDAVLAKARAARLPVAEVPY